MEVRKHADDKFITVYGKKGPRGICVCSTKQAIIIGQSQSPATSAPCNAAVETLAKYLIEKGF